MELGSFNMSSNTNLFIKTHTPWTIIPIKTLNLPISYSWVTQTINKTIKMCKIQAMTSSSPTINKEAQQCHVEFKTMGGCKLGISRYPDFEYDADGGFGVGNGLNDDQSKEISVSFDVGKLYIPSLTSGTTRFLGLPLPPFLRIDIVPQNFQGSIDTKSGKVELEFKAKFWFSIGTLYKAPPLLVVTVLTTEESRGVLRKGKGQRMDKEGKCKLVGVATVDRIDDAFMNTFLALPTECLAILNATIAL